MDRPFDADRGGLTTKDSGGRWNNEAAGKGADNIYDEKRDVRKADRLAVEKGNKQSSAAV